SDTAVTEPDGVDQLRTKGVGLFQAHPLPARENAVDEVLPGVGLSLRGGVKEVTAGEAIRARQLMVQPDRKVIFVQDGDAGEVEVTCVPGAAGHKPRVDFGHEG